MVRLLLVLQPVLLPTYLNVRAAVDTDLLQGRSHLLGNHIPQEIWNSLGNTGGRTKHQIASKAPTSEHHNKHSSHTPSCCRLAKVAA